MTAAHHKRGPLYQICMAIDYAEQGIKLDGNKMIWVVESEDRGDLKVWKATRECGSVLYASTLKKLRRIMIDYTDHLKGGDSGARE